MFDIQQALLFQRAAVPSVPIHCVSRTHHLPKRYNIYEQYTNCLKYFVFFKGIRTWMLFSITSSLQYFFVSVHQNIIDTSELNLCIAISSITALNRLLLASKRFKILVFKALLPIFKKLKLYFNYTFKKNHLREGRSLPAQCKDHTANKRKWYIHIN